jgi:hypothetical protein
MHGLRILACKVAAQHLNCQVLLPDPDCDFLKLDF